MNLPRSNKVIVIWHTGQGTLLSSVLAIAKVIVLGNRVSVIGRVQRLLGVNPLVALDEQLRTLAGVDAVADVLEVVVVQVASAEAEGRAARVQVVPIVVVEGDAEVALVFVAVAVRVANQRGLPVVVDEGVGDGYVVGGVGKINETIVVVLVVVTVRRDVAVVDPDVGGFFYFISPSSPAFLGGILTDSKGITIVSQNLLNTQVPDDHVRSFLDHTTPISTSSLSPVKKETYMPKPSSTALESLPIILVLLPTLT